MAFFEYVVEPENRAFGKYKVIVRAKGDAPECASQHTGATVGYVMEMYGPNPVLALKHPLGIDGIEAICKEIRKVMTPP